MKRFLIMMVIFIFGLVFLDFSPVFAGDVEDLYKRIEQLEEKVEKQGEKTELLGKVGENITFSGAIELDYSYTDPRDTTVVNSDSTSDLNIGAAELGLEVCFHEYVTGNFILKGEDLDDDDHVFWDEATITIQKEDFPLYFVGGKRGQPFGMFESHLISDTITQDCYEIAKTGATVGFVPGILGLDISATVYRGDTLIEHLDEAEVGAEVVIPDNDDVSSFIANITMEPAEGLLLSAYWDSEPGNDERNETLGGTVHYEFWKVTLDTEYIGATKREKTGGKEYKEFAWFAAAAFQVIDPLEIAVRYGAFNDDIDGDQDGHLENRYSVGASYTLFEKDDFATTLMLEYRKSNYENEAGVTVEDTVNEAFAKLAIEF